MLEIRDASARVDERSQRRLVRIDSTTVVIWEDEKARKARQEAAETLVLLSQGFGEKS